MTEPTRTTGTAAQSEVRGSASSGYVARRRELGETKPSFMTTEFWMTLAGIAALILAYNFADEASLDLWRTCLLATLGGIAYVVSRGLAKSGSHHDKWSDDSQRY